MKLRHTCFLLLALLACAACSAPSSRIPAGWKARFDVGDHQLSEVSLLETPTGLLAETGPNVIFWQEGPSLQPPYRIAVQVHNLDSHGHPHGVGLLIGGQRLDAADQTYAYFLVRGDGYFLVKRRDGAMTSDLQSWKLHPIIGKENDFGLAQNELAIDVGVEETVFAVNGVEVFAAPTASLPVVGGYGLRMVHDLKILFSDLRVEPASMGR